jgi:hypothetical protein
LKFKEMKTMRTTAGAVFVCLALSCGSGDPSPPTDIAVEQVAALWRKAVCDKIYSCCSPAERMGNLAIGTDAQSCQPALERDVTYFVGDLPASVKGGRVIYHPDRMTKCLADLQARPCDQMKSPAGGLDVTQSCGDVFEATVEPGGACLEYWDCKGGWCAGDLGFLQDTCQARAPAGHECDEGTECASWICQEAKCVNPPAGSGNICNLGSDASGEHQGGSRRGWK